MATPEGASDMQLYERHQKLKQQLDAIVMEEWDAYFVELEESLKIIFYMFMKYESNQVFTNSCRMPYDNRM